MVSVCLGRLIRTFNISKMSSDELEEPGFSKIKRKHNVALFARGNIKRIKVKNFLTYNAVELFPGANLNLIIGPNGTGKSTIVCAICLGLAGKPSILGRAGSIADYIQHGFSKAFIEIDLVQNENKYITISREINKSGSSAWQLNGKTSNLKSVEEVIRNMNIQVDNLCQFLPQDRVAEFVKMSPQELLEDTQKAVGLSAMYDKHMKLKQLRKEQKEVELNTRTSSNQLEQEMERNRRLEEEVKIYEERNACMKAVEFLKLKKLWVVYDLKRVSFQKRKDELTVMKNDLVENMALNEPYERKVEQLTAKADKMNNILKKIGAESDKVFEIIRSKGREIEDLSERVLTVEQNLKIKRQEEELRENKLRETVEELRNLESTLAEKMDNREDIQEKLRENNERLNIEMNQLNEVQSETINLKAEKSAKVRELRGVDDEIGRIKDTSSKQLEILHHRSVDAYKAVTWLRENVGLFKMKVYEPIMTTIIMKDKSFAKYVEAHIPFRDMEAFVCEDSDDMNKFLSVIKDKMHLKVNAVMVPREPLASFSSRVPISHIARFGFHNYLSELFTAPDGIMRYLCQMYKIHEMPIGNSVTEDCIEQIFAETKFSRFYTPNRCYSSRQSKYGDRLRSTMSTEISERNLLVATAETEKLNVLTKNKQALENALRSISEKEEELQNTERKITMTQEELRKIRKTLFGQRDFIKNVQVQISNKRKLKENLEKNAKDLSEEYERTYREISALNTKKCKRVKEHQDSLKQRIALGKNRVRMACKMSLVAKQNIMAKEALAEVSHTVNALQDQIREVAAELRSLKDSAAQALHEAKRKSNITSSGAELTAEVKRRFEGMQITLEEIDAQINQEQAKADCMCQIDKEVVQEFVNRKKEIERLQKEAESIQYKMERYTREIDKLKADWLPELEQLLQRVNSNFSEFFSRLKCVGEVSLKQGENPLDFDAYGVCIKVKYRKEEPLHELSVFHQSGGERSVATVLYMMALQELTKVPFRCIDEINQGMDAINERKVFEFVVETACRKNTSQYFLLTPKLLPNLAYSENVMPHIIFNGPELGLKGQWNIKKIIKAAKKSIE